MLAIQESVDAGTYLVAIEHVADAIIAGPFALSMPEAPWLLRDRVADLAEPPQSNDDN